MTVELLDFYQKPSSNPVLEPIFIQFLQPLREKLNQLSYTLMAVKAAKTMKTPKESIDFLGGIANLYEKDPNEISTFIFSKIECAHYQLRNNDLLGCKSAMEQCEKALNNMTYSADPIVTASYYRVSADYYKVKQKNGNSPKKKRKKFL